MIWVILALLVQTVRISIPYQLSALGGVFSERGGVINIALEGLLLIGAFSYIVGNWYAMKWFSGSSYENLSPLIGLLSGIISSALIGLILSIICITFKADQIITGIAINLFALGFTKFTNEIIFHSPSNSEVVLPFPAPIIFKGEQIGIFNTLFHPIILFTFIIVLISYPLFFNTRFGLRLRAVGENPSSADSAGISVSLYRYSGVIIGSILAGIGGAWLSLDQCRFSANMSAGRGFIALAAIIVGKWHPIGAAGACLLFGLAESCQLFLQAGGIKFLPNQIVQMFPYILTLLVLAGFIGRAVPPAADGIPYEKEKI